MWGIKIMVQMARNGPSADFILKRLRDDTVVINSGYQSMENSVTLVITVGKDNS